MGKVDIAATTINTNERWGSSSLTHIQKFMFTANSGDTGRGLNSRRFAFAAMGDCIEYDELIHACKRYNIFRVEIMLEG